MTETPHAADLIAQAEAATTTEELDEIEAQANDRVTVIDAVEKRREELASAPAEEQMPLEAAPTEVVEPTEAPPELESLAEKVYREAHTVPESTTPSDVVPNRPNIRAPGTEEIVEEEAPPPETDPEPEVDPIP